MSSSSRSWPLPVELTAMVCRHLLPQAPSATSPTLQEQRSRDVPVEASSSSASLAAMARCSKLFNEAATPVLYRKIVLKRIGSIRRLSETLENGSPLLASYIREMHLPKDIEESYPMAGTQQTALLRSVLSRVTNLEALFAHIRIWNQQTVVLRQILIEAQHHPISHSLRYLTLNCLGTGEQRDAILTVPRHLPGLTHLHFIGILHAEIEDLSTTLPRTLKVLRFSQVDLPLPEVFHNTLCESLDSLECFLFEMRAFQETDAGFVPGPLNEGAVSVSCHDMLNARAKTAEGFTTPYEGFVVNRIPDSVYDHPFHSNAAFVEFYDALHTFKFRFAARVQEARARRRVATAFEVRITAPRYQHQPLPARRVEFRVNWEAVRRCNDIFAFFDDDMFDLVDRHPEVCLKYGYIPNSGERMAYWPHILPLPY